MLIIRDAQMDTMARALERDPVQPCPLRATWVAIALVGDDGQPIAGARYELRLPDGVLHEGTLDAQGEARFEGLAGGRCEVCFPDLDSEAWETC